MKKLLSLALALLLTISCLTFPAFAEDGTLTPNEEGIYEISTADQLYQFAELVNGGETTAKAVLTADIVVNEDVLNESGELNTGDFRVWTPIVDFKGTFDGQGHTISGIYFNNADVDRGGLFANITGSSSRITNLKLADSYICGSTDTGGIVGYLSHGNVTGCTNSGTVIGSTYVGGIVGYAVSGEIANCTNSGTVTASNAAVGGIVGGISGVPVSGCSNTGAVSGISKIGGIVGSNSACTISDCTNSGSITGEKLAGGIAGYGEYSGPSYGRRYPKIENCSNIGDITITTSYAGGIVGDNGGSITGCSNTGSITGSSMVGGIAGASTSVYDSGNSGAVTGSSSVGGIVGGGSGGFAKTCIVRRSWNTASVKGTSQVGGIGGGIVEAEDCYNQGSVTGGKEFYDPDTSVGGIVGYGTAENCYNIGNLIINGQAPKIGGIIGEIYNANYVSNNHYLVGTAPYGIENKDTAGKAEPKTLQDFTRGKVCYLLQSATSEQLWGQNLDNGEPVQDFPVLSDARVYLTTAKTCDGQDYTWAEGEEVYSNYEDTVTTVHSYDEGTCPLCGAEDPDYVSYIRLAGSNRFETATLVADQMKEALGVEQFDAVILANGYNFADALAGSYLSATKKAPILLTWNDAETFNFLNDATIEYVKNNLKPGGTVYILGGTSAVPASIDKALSEFRVQRMDGANRFETNIMILEEAGIPEGSEVLVCTSTNFADSLSASAAGKPILLVWNEGGMLFDNQISYLQSLDGCTFTVVGGESAVSAKMLDIIKGYGETTRLAGSNRFETSVLVAERFFPEAASAVLAYAWDFPDGLCGGGLANAMNAPLILTMTNFESQAVDYVKSQGIQSGIVLGGEGLISEGSVHLIFGLIGEE